LIALGEERYDYASLTFPERDGCINDIRKAIQSLAAADVIREANKIAAEAQAAADEAREIEKAAQADAAKAAAEAAEKEKAAEKARLAAEKAQKEAEAAEKRIAQKAKKLEKDFNAFSLSRKAMAVKAAKSPSKGKVKITAKKNKLAYGYHFQLSTNKKFKGSKRSKFTRNASYTFGSLKKKTYYIRVRSYTSDSRGIRVYSKWSKVKKVRTK